VFSPWRLFGRVLLETTAEDILITASPAAAPSSGCGSTLANEFSLLIIGSLATATATATGPFHYKGGLLPDSAGKAKQSIANATLISSNSIFERPLLCWLFYFILYWFCVIFFVDRRKRKRRRRRSGVCAIKKNKEERQQSYEERAL
jgi:cbb3-type cytochrome oxidase subunit 3